MGMDKKVIGGRLRLVLLECIGRAIVRDDVPDGVLSGILREAFDRDRNAS
jgi:3-dehydroquinate synthetase